MLRKIAEPEKTKGCTPRVCFNGINFKQKWLKSKRRVCVNGAIKERCTSLSVDNWCQRERQHLLLRLVLTGSAVCVCEFIIWRLGPIRHTHMRDHRESGRFWGFLLRAALSARCELISCSRNHLARLYIYIVSE